MKFFSDDKKRFEEKEKKTNYYGTVKNVGKKSKNIYFITLAKSCQKKEKRKENFIT